MYQHPGVARFFASRLIATFASLDLANSLVEPVAQSLIVNRYDPTEAIRMILRSSAFFAEANRADSFANPAERIISLTRFLDLPVDRFSHANGVNNLPGHLRNMIWESGYPISRMPTVFGIQEAGKIVGNDVTNGITFLSPQRQLNAINQLSNYLTNLHQAQVNNQTEFRWADLLPRARPTPDEVLEHFSLQLGVDLADYQYELLREYITQTATQVHTVEGLSVPLPSKTFEIDWSVLTDAQFNSLWTQKAPGLIVLLWSLPEVSLR